MNKSFFSKKTATIILQNRTLRILFSLMCTLVMILIILMIIRNSYGVKIAINQKQIGEAEAQLMELQKVIMGEEDVRDIKADTRSFASYDEIVPFISLLESLFAIIDPESKINVKNQEKEIMVNRYADYDVLLNPEKADLFLKALDELHKSKYLTKIVSFNMNYAPGSSDNKNELQDVNFTIRLYFK